MNPTEDFTSPHQIAAALVAVAERLMAMPETVISATRVDLEMWVDGTSPDARQTVDLLGYAATGDTGAHAFTAKGRSFYRTPNPVMNGLAARAVAAIPESITV